MDKNELARLIKAKLPQYNEASLNAVVTDYETNFLPESKAEVDNYLLRGEMPKLVVAGYSADRLMNEWKMTPIAAIATLDWLRQEPEKAKESLQRGYDRLEL